MKKIAYILALLITVQACKSKNIFEGSLNIETVHVERSSEEISPGKDGYKVNLNYYKVNDGPEHLRDSINNATVTLLSTWFKISPSNFNVSYSVTSHMQKYFDELKEHPNCEICPVFLLGIKTEPVYQNKQVVSLVYSWNIDEGGAHGYYSKNAFVFNKNTGSKITYNSLVKAEEEGKLLEVAEAMFRENIGISQTDPFPDIYGFRNNKFHLSENFSFSTKGLTFYYNPYEIAPYFVGVISLSIPFEQIKAYINYLD